MFSFLCERRIHLDKYGLHKNLEKKVLKAKLVFLIFGSREKPDLCQDPRKCNIVWDEFVSVKFVHF